MNTTCIHHLNKHPHYRQHPMIKMMTDSLRFICALQEQGWWEGKRGCSVHYICQQTADADKNQCNWGNTLLIRHKGELRTRSEA